MRILLQSRYQTYVSQPIAPTNVKEPDPATQAPQPNVVPIHGTIAADAASIPQLAALVSIRLAAGIPPLQCVCAETGGAVRSQIPCQGSASLA